MNGGDRDEIAQAYVRGALDKGMYEHPSIVHAQGGIQTVVVAEALEGTLEDGH
ncbi:hypothetical protein [Acidisoma sp. L85]|uniref:hypothetical protein n=1 Tax=Acidisoma sp. L85 TaxID=1641850 RepID=UPI00131E2D21|nr:hypothetical protein [Acidisoma sp. L85]